MAVITPQERLVLRTITATLRNNLVASGLVEWNVHQTEMNDRNGFIISEQRGPEFTIRETTGSVADLTSTGVQDTVFGAQTIRLNRTFNVSMGASDLERVTTIGEARNARALNNAMARLASAIDAHIFKVAAKAFPLSTGTWGNDIIDPEEFSQARTKLAESSLESDFDINAVIAHRDRQKLAKYIYDDNASLSSEGSRAMRRGFSGGLDNIPIRASNQLGRITTGTRSSTAAVNGAGQNVNYADVADSGTAAGEYLTQTFNLSGLGAGATVKAGEVFTIAGVQAWDAEIGQTRPFQAQFTVIEDATANGSGQATVKIFPALVVQTGTESVNNSHATVNAAPADGAVVTFEGAPDTTYMPRVMWKREAIVVHTAPLVTPHTGRAFRRELAEAERDGQAPLMPRVWLFSDPLAGTHKARIDVFVEAQVRDRFMGIRFFGN